jgi:prophage antirepressor-like protein
MNSICAVSTPQAGAASALAFPFDSHTVRAVLRDGEPWFVAADVCAALDLPNTTRALDRLDEDEQALISIQGISRGNDLVNLINESGLYSLILGSRKPEAKRFKKWVTSVVLPAIRKTGQYATPDRNTRRHAMEVAMAAGAAVRRSVCAQLSRGVPAKDVRYFVSLYATPDGEINFDGHTLRNGEVVGTWAELAAMLRTGQVAQADALEVAEAACHAAYIATANSPDGEGQRLARVIRGSVGDLSVADCHAIALAATQAQWAKLQTAKQRMQPVGGVA